MPTDLPPSRERTFSFKSSIGRYFFATRIDRYVSTEVLSPFFGGLIFFVFILLMFQALRLADFFIVHGVPLTLLGRLTGLMCLSFLPPSLPPAFLFAVLFGFGRLSSDSELVAMKANGISLGRMSVPVVIISVLVATFSLVLNLTWVPQGQKELKKVLIKVGNSKVVSAINEGTFTTGFFGLLIFADKIDPNTNELKHVFIYDEREAKNPLAVVAKSGEISSVRTQSELSAAAMMNLRQGGIHKNDIIEKTYQKIDFKDYRLFLKVEEPEGGHSAKPALYTYSELRDRIAKGDAPKVTVREWQTEIWRRVAISVTPIFFVFLGMGFGTFRTRAVRAGAMLVALITLGSYWTLQTIFLSLIDKGHMLPFVGMQLPNALVILVGIWAFRRSNW